MDQQFHTFKAPTLDEAYREMRRQLGDDALVVRTTQVRDGGFWGFFTKPMVELTASVPAPTPRTRSLTPAERKYAAAGSVGSEEAMTDTVAYFQKLVSDAQRRLGRGGANANANANPNANANGPQAGPSSAARESVVPFKRPAESTPTRDDLRREIAQMRDMLQVLLAETPSAGIPAEFAPHYRMLVDRGLSRNIAAGLMVAAIKDSDLGLLRDPRVFLERLKVEIRKRIPVTGGLALSAGSCRVVALVGATGVGKTTNLAKLAAFYAVRQRAKVALITSDTYRVAATEQLRIYANIIGLPMSVVNDPREMAAAVKDYRQYDLVFIDTAGGSQFNMKQIQELKEMLGAAQPDETALVLSANTQFEELRNVVTNFKCLNPGSLFFSKLDETRRFGVMLSIAFESALPLSYLSIGQSVPDDIVLARPSLLANLIVEGRERRGRSSTKPS